MVVLTCVVYLPVLHATFVWDDSFMVTDNKMLRTASGFPHDIWFTNKPADHIPVTLSALWLQYQLWGINPVGYHVVNVLLHALGAVLLWRVLLRLRLPGAWLAAAVFALHPVCAASAAWVSEQKNTVSLIFYLWTLLFYLRFEEKPNAQKLCGGVGCFCSDAVDERFGCGAASGVVAAGLVEESMRLSGLTLLRLAPFFVLAFAEGVSGDLVSESSRDRRGDDSGFESGRAVRRRNASGLVLFVEGVGAMEYHGDLPAMGDRLALGC